MNLRFFIILGICSVIILACKDKKTTPFVPEPEKTSAMSLQETIDKHIHDYFNDKKQFGQIQKITMVSGWEEGPRYVILTNAGLFMAYLNQNYETVQLWQKNREGEFIRIF